MAGKLDGKKIAILATDGVEQVELTEPRKALEDAVRFTADFARAHKPIAAICHAPWVLVEAGIVKGRTITSFPSLQTDVRNAGGTWVDEEVHVDHGLVTSRKPDDIPAFSAKAIEEFCEGPHEDMPQPAGAATAS